MVRLIASVCFLICLQCYIHISLFYCTILGRHKTCDDNHDSDSALRLHSCPAGSRRQLHPGNGVRPALRELQQSIFDAVHRQLFDTGRYPGRGAGIIARNRAPRIGREWTGSVKMNVQVGVPRAMQMCLCWSNLLVPMPQKQELQ